MSNNDALTCTICCENYQLEGSKCPRTLAECGHTFCTSCLQDLVKDNKICCPTCRKESNLGDKGVEGVNKAFALIELIGSIAKDPKGVTKAAQDEVCAADQVANADDNDVDATGVRLTAFGAPSMHNKDLHDVVITLQPAKLMKRAPVDICAVIDVSGSMCADAKLKNEQGQSESHGLCLLDVVKHAVRTIIGVMGEQDRLSIVSYSDVAKVAFKLTKMTKKAKVDAEQALLELHPNGMTNMWAGLKSGLDTLNTLEKGRTRSLMLLTDGCPNVSPAAGYLKALSRHRAKQDAFVTVNTFGFGYLLDTHLLRDLAKVGQGSFSFIPDSSFVGTAFVNSVASTLTTVAQNVCVKLTPTNGATIREDALQDNELDGHVAVQEGNSIELSINALIDEIPRHIVVPMDLSTDTKLVGEAYLTVEASFDTCETGAKGTTTSRSVKLSTVASERNQAAQVEPQALRALFVQRIVSALPSSKKASDAALRTARSKIEDLIEQFEAKKSSDKLVKALLVDLKGQVAEAFSCTAFYNRWGLHYILSLLRSHIVEQCANFKDESLQIYAGELFSDLQEEGDETFCALPPPKPAAPPKEVIAAMGSSYVPPQAPKVSMRRYHSRGAPCVQASSLVHTSQGKMMASQVKAGQKVLVNSSGKLATVQCVVETKIESGSVDLCQLETGLAITPFHPVFINKQWQFPVDLAPPAARSTPSVYSFVLSDRSASVLIDNTLVASLGHGMSGPVIGHQFFGTERVVHSLARCEGFQNGHVVLRENCDVRDQNGLVCDLIQV